MKDIENQAMETTPCEYVQNGYPRKTAPVDSRPVDWASITIDPADPKGDWSATWVRYKLSRPCPYRIVGNPIDGVVVWEVHDESGKVIEVLPEVSHIVQGKEQGDALQEVRQIRDEAKVDQSITEQQRVFVEEYLRTGDVERAREKAGYTDFMDSGEE